MNAKLLIIGTTALATGCAGGMWRGEWTENQCLQSGQPTEYCVGMRQGCASGYKAGGNIYALHTKDVMRYAQDDLYHQGWDDGFAQCYGATKTGPF